VPKGRKKALSEKQAIALRARAEAGEAKATLARVYGISRETVYQYLRGQERSFCVLFFLEI
jgi:DNA invertase Pin-like site-specific DNA recombinase